MFSSYIGYCFNERIVGIWSGAGGLLLPQEDKPTPGCQGHMKKSDILTCSAELGGAKSVCKTCQKRGYGCDECQVRLKILLTFHYKESNFQKSFWKYVCKWYSCSTGQSTPVILISVQWCNVQSSTKMMASLEMGVTCMTLPLQRATMSDDLCE